MRMTLYFRWESLSEQQRNLEIEILEELPPPALCLLEIRPELSDHFIPDIIIDEIISG